MWGILLLKGGDSGDGPGWSSIIAIFVLALALTIFIIKKNINDNININMKDDSE